MSDEKKTTENAGNNVLQFPVRRKEAEIQVEKSVPPLPTAKQQQLPNPGTKKTLSATVLAIGLISLAVNKYTFETYSAERLDLASTGRGRVIASVQPVQRDAAWEKDLAEKLASAQVRDVASTGIGRPATIEEKLRWGVLEEKYTITYSPDAHQINSILLQDPISSPAYVLDRQRFLNEYGHLFESKFAIAKLKSTEKSNDKTVENYTLFDKENKPKGEAHFELDRHKRLLSLKVEPTQI